MIQEIKKATGAAQTSRRRRSFYRLAFFALAGLLVFLPAAARAQKGTVIKRQVRFARGKSAAVISGSAQAYTSYAYTVQAAQGQTMSVSVSSPNKNVRFTVFEPGGLEPFSGDEDLTSWTDSLPKTGTYKIMVFSTSDAGASAYTLKISIK